MSDRLTFWHRRGTPSLQIVVDQDGSATWVHSGAPLYNKPDLASDTWCEMILVPAPPRAGSVLDARLIEAGRITGASLSLDGLHLLPPSPPQRPIIFVIS